MFQVAFAAKEARYARRLFGHLHSLNGGEGDGVNNIFNQRAARQIVYRLVQALQHRANAEDVGIALYGFICAVTGVEIRENKHGGFAGHFAVGRF